MAHVLIFDSNATADADGNPIGTQGDGTIFAGGGALGTSYTSNMARSKPVPLFGAPDGEVGNVDFEFWLDANGGDSLALRWCMEFYNDAPQPFIRQGVNQGGSKLPAWHIAPDLNAEKYWCREHSEELQGSGAVTHFAVTRSVTLSVGAGEGALGAPGAIFPMVVHGLYVRLALWRSGAMPAGGRLRAYAVLGGIDAPTTREALTAPWAG